MHVPQIPARFVLGALLLLGPAARAQDDPVLLAPPFDPTSLDQAAMMEAMRQAMDPTTHHEMLDVLAGSWRTETTMWMGGPGSEPMTTQGTATNEWILGGRFLRSSAETTMMGSPMTGVITLGYDTFAGRYEMSSMSSMGTAMDHATGYATPDGRAVVFYGEMDEPMLDVHGRMVKYVLRLESDDLYVLEVHDLHIGTADNKVLETRFHRQG